MPEMMTPTPDLREITAKNIATLRTAKKMTQLELGEALSYSDKAISKWERGEAVPDAYVLLEMARLFGVSVDFLLTPHTADEKPPRPNADRDRLRLVITLISFFGVFFAATVAFVTMALVWQVYWQIFIYALPAALTTLLVFNSVWGRPRRNFPIIGLLVASAILVAYIACLPHNYWMLFLILAPAELLVFLSKFLIRKK